MQTWTLLDQLDDCDMQYMLTLSDAAMIVTHAATLQS